MNISTLQIICSSCRLNQSCKKKCFTLYIILIKNAIFNVFYFSKRFYFLLCQHFSFFNSTKPTKVLDKSEHKDVAEPDLLESESSSDSDEEPQLSNVRKHTKT